MNTNYINIESENHEEDENEYFIDELNVDYDHIQNENYDNPNELDSKGNHVSQKESQGENNKDSKSNSIEPIYVMTLELDQNKSANIKIYSDSVPYELAYDFCKVNNLDYKSLNFLAGEIENLMTNYNTKLLQESKYANNLQDEIVELDEEQLSTEKNRNNDDREKLSFLYSDRKYKESIRNEKEIEEIMNDEEKNEEVKLEGLDSSKYSHSRNVIDVAVVNQSNIIKNHAENMHAFEEDIDYNSEVKNSSIDAEGNSDKITNQVNQNENLIEINNKSQNEKYKNMKMPLNSFINKNSPPDSFNLRNSTPKNNLNNLENSPSVKINLGSSPSTHNSLRQSRISQAQMDEDKLQSDRNSRHDTSTKHKMTNEYNSNGNLSTIDNNNNQCNSVMFHYQMDNNIKRSYNEYNRSKSVNKIGKKQSIFERLFQDAELKRTKPKHGKNYKNYYTDLDKKDKSNQLNTEHGQLLYYKEKLLKEEKTREASIKQISEASSNFTTCKANLSKIPTSPLVYHTNSISENNLDFNKTIKKSSTQKINSEENFYQENNLKSDESNWNSSKIKDKKIRSNSCTLGTNINSNFSKLKCQPYKNLTLNEEKQKLKKILQMQKIRNETENNFTFKPIVSNKTQCNLNFLQRQEIYRENSKNRKKEIEEILKYPTDEKGSALFHPKLITESKNTRALNHDGSAKSVFEKNYEIANKYQLNKENLRKKYESEQAPISYQNEESEEIFQSLKEDAFKNLFQDLDMDGDNLISSINIGLNHIPSEIRKIIDPIIIELKEENETLNENEFVEAMGHLFDYLNYSDRQTLIKCYKNKNVSSRRKKHDSEINSFLFRPTIDKNSKKLADNYDRKLIQSLSQHIKEDHGNKCNVKMINPQTYFRIGSNLQSRAMENIKDATFQNFKRRVCY